MRRKAHTLTDQQEAVLRNSKTARAVRARYRPGARVWSLGGPQGRRIEEGTILRHVPQTNAQGGYLVVLWDSGFEGTHGAISLEVQP